MLRAPLFLFSVAAAATAVVVAAATAAAETAHCDYEDKNDYPPAVVISTHSSYLLFSYVKCFVFASLHSTVYVIREKCVTTLLDAKIMKVGFVLCIEL